MKLTSPFGSAMNTRSYVASTKYRYGFNTQEKDDELAGDNNSYTAEFWQYDGRLGRRFNLDPKPNPSNSDYSCLGNNPIWFSDYLGDSIKIRYKENTGFKRIFEKSKYYTFKNDGTDKEFKSNSKYLKNTINAIAKIIENDKNYICKIISDEKQHIQIRQFGFRYQEAKPGVYVGKVIRWQHNSGEVFEDLNFTMAPYEILNHELGHAYIDLYYSADEKKKLEEEFNKLSEEDQAKWNYSWEEKVVVEKMESELSNVIHPGKKRNIYVNKSYSIKVKNSTSTTK
jgi:hypothetical protein